jgi:opacity protein-like surface antigen
MKRCVRTIAMALGLALFAATLGAQQRHLVLSVYGGGADHLADFESGASVWLMPGHNLGANVGLELSRHLAVRGDFTYARNPSRGSILFAGSDIIHYYYGVQLEGRYPLGYFAPFAFIGVGGASIDQDGVDQFEPFSKPAAMLGGGIAYSFPRSPLEVFGAVKGISYKWDRTGFDRQLFDVTYSLGMRYKVPVTLPF